MGYCRAYVMCFLISSILYYKELNKTKYNIIKELEEYIGVCPFICESYASPKKASWHIELEIPSMFAVGYVVYGIAVAIIQFINTTNIVEKVTNVELIIGILGLAVTVFCQRLKCKK